MMNESDHIMQTIEANLYGYRNKKNGKIYIGYHKTDDSDDLYSSSSTSPYFHVDRTRGDLEKSILAEGSVYDMINLEYAILSQFDAKANDKFYNKSNGGGNGVDKSYVPDQNLFTKIVDWVSGKEIATEKKSVGVFNKLKMDKLARSIKEGEREIVDVSVQQIYTIHRNQVRMQSIHHDHVEELVIAFSDPATARMLLTPIIILVDKNGKMIKLLDGNHRVEAAYKSKWVELPAIIVSEEEFDNNDYNQEYFGVVMNDQPYKVLGNNEDDLSKQLMTLHDMHPEMAIDSLAFMDLAKDLFGGKGGLWHSTKITKRCKKLAEVAEEEQLKQGKNFISYSGAQIDKLKRELLKNNDNCAVISQSSDSICNAGIGGILNTMTSLGYKKGIILVHYPKYAVFEQRHAHYKQFKDILELIGNLDIKLKFLNPFKQNQIDGLPIKTK